MSCKCSMYNSKYKAQDICFDVSFYGNQIKMSSCNTQNRMSDSDFLSLYCLSGSFMIFLSSLQKKIETNWFWFRKYIFLLLSSSCEFWFSNDAFSREDTLTHTDLRIQSILGITHTIFWLWNSAYSSKKNSAYNFSQA